MSRNCNRLVSLSIVAIGMALLLLSASHVNAQSIHNRPLLSERERLQRRADQLYRGPDTEFKRSKYMLPGRDREQHLASASHVKGHSERIQFLNRKMSGLASEGAALDYKAIAKAAGEMRKRASQLRYYLGLPKPGDAEAFNQGRDRMGREELLAALQKLDAVVRSFGTNPLLGKQGVIDAGQATSAGRDLEEIIAVSDNIRKSAKRLNRQVRESH